MFDVRSPHIGDHWQEQSGVGLSLARLSVVLCVVLSLWIWDYNTTSSTTGEAWSNVSSALVSLLVNPIRTVQLCSKEVRCNDLTHQNGCTQNKL